MIALENLSRADLEELERIIAQLSIAGLKQLKSNLAHRRAVLRAAKRVRSPPEPHEAPRERHFLLEEFFPQSNQLNPKGKAREPKYRDPDNPENTWSGRGLNPRWVKAWIKKGGSLESLRNQK